MVDSAAHLVDEVLPKRPIRQRVRSVQHSLRYQFATNAKVSQALSFVHRVIITLPKASRLKSGTFGQKQPSWQPKIQYRSMQKIRISICANNS